MRCQLLRTKNPASPRQHWVCGLLRAGHFLRLLLAGVRAAAGRADRPQVGQDRLDQQESAHRPQPGVGRGKAAQDQRRHPGSGPGRQRHGWADRAKIKQFRGWPTRLAESPNRQGLVHRRADPQDAVAAAVRARRHPLPQPLSMPPHLRKRLADGRRQPMVRG